MNNLASNLKYLRKTKKLTQQLFANELQIKRSLVGAYEEKRAEPKYELLQRFAEFYNISIDELLNDKINEKWTPKPKSDWANVRVLSITVDSKNQENIELVSAKASAVYLNGYADPEYVGELPKFYLPIFRQGTFRGFEIRGDSMLPLESGTIVIGQYLDDWSNLRLGETYIIISKNDGIVYKRIGSKFRDDKPLHLLSDNPIYEPYSIPWEDVIEIWTAKAFISTSFPEPTAEPTLENITSMVVQMQRSISDLQRAKV